MPPFDRYSVENREFDGKLEKAIFRRDLVTNGNRFLMIRGLQKQRKALESDKHPSRHIYLDGAAKGPFYDKKRMIFSLDHHDECVRQITDSSCIQEMHLARTRVIGALGHIIAGNDPDLDTIFAGWALMNADLLAHDDRIFRRVQPLMIVEGNIDTYGFGFEELTGLPSDVITESRQRLNWLMREERDIKQRGRWNTIDFADFTERSLQAFDRYAFYRDTLDVPVTMDVHEKHQITKDG